MHLAEACARQLRLQGGNTELTHLERGAGSSMKDQVVSDLEGSIAPPIDQDPRFAQRHDAILIQFREMLAHVVVRVAKDGEAEKAAGLQQAAYFFESALDGRRDVLQHVGRKNEIV